MPLRSILTTNTDALLTDFVNLESVLEVLPCGILITDAQTKKTLFASRQLVEWIPDDSDFEGKHPFENIIGHYFEQEPGHSPITYRCVLKNSGSHLKVFQAKTQVNKLGTDGQPLILLTTVENVTEQEYYKKRFEQITNILEETERMVGFGTWTWDMDTNRVDWSKGSYRTFGYEENSRQPASVALYESHVHPDDVDMMRKQNQHFIESGEVLNSYSHRIITKTGEVKYVQSYAKMVKDEEGNVVSSIGSTVDMTELYKAEQALEEQVIKLNRSNQDLEQFAYVASHDLQEPLRKIIAFGERLHKKLGDSADADVQLYINRMLDASQRMRQLIDNILSLSRLNRVTDLQPVNLEQTLKEVRQDLELKIEETGATFEVEPLPTVNGMGIQLHQLLFNLVSNAIKFIEPGTRPHIRIQGTIHQKPHTEKAEGMATPYVEIKLSDNGIGFEQQYADQIFIIFKRLNGRTQYSGTGLGLAIGRKIVENHEGRIWAESEPGHGSTFTILLPLASS